MCTCTLYKCTCSHLPTQADTTRNWFSLLAYYLSWRAHSFTCLSSATYVFVSFPSGFSVHCQHRIGVTSAPDREFASLTMYLQCDHHVLGSLFPITKRPEAILILTVQLHTSHGLDRKEKNRYIGDAECTVTCYSAAIIMV